MKLKLEVFYWFLVEDSVRDWLSIEFLFYIESHENFLAIPTEIWY